MKKNFLELINNHINANKKVYFILLIIYFFTIIFGAFCVSFLSQNDTNALHGFFEDFMDKYRTSKVDFASIYLNVYTNNLKNLFLMFLSAFIVIGMPFVVLVFCLKIFFIGFIFGSILRIYGLNGILFGIGNVFLQNFLSLPLLFVFCALSIKFSVELFLKIRKKNRKLKSNSTFEKDAIFYIFSFIFFAVLMAVINLIETFLVMIIV